MIIHIVKNKVKAGTAAEYTKVAEDFMAYVKEHCAGCISARVMVDTVQEDVVANLIEWESKAALEAHLNGDSLSKFVDRLMPYFEGNTTEVYEIAGE